MNKNTYYKYGLSCLGARRIVRQMRSIIDAYGFVTVADFYDLVGEESYSYRCCKMGWRSLNHVTYRLGLYGITFEFPNLRVIE